MFVFVLCAVLAIGHAEPPPDKKFGNHIGQLSTLAYDVSGDVYAVDGKTLFIKDFTYTGGGPAGFFWIGPINGRGSNGPNDDGLIIPDENGSTKPLGRYNKKDITLTIPGNKSVSELGFFSIWCTDFSVDFGHVLIPQGFRHPEPLTVTGFPTFEHEVTSGPITVVDAQTFLIPDFTYDGQAPAAYFWVGKGQTPSPTGFPIPDENGSSKPFTHSYNKKTIVLSLPGDLTVYDIDYLSVWCEDFRVNFGHINIPRDLNVPPSLRMLGVRPESKLNCEVLEDHLAFEVRWAVAGNSLVIQLVGKIDGDQYMSFGLSGSNNRPRMVGADVVVVGLDKETGKGFATDYFLTAKSYCALGEGACPDNEIEPRKNNIRLLNAAVVNDFTMITFQRPLKTKDADYDIVIDRDSPMEVVWAIGGMDDKGLTKFHTIAYTKESKKITFGRKPVWNCPLSETDEEVPTGNFNRQRPNQGPSSVVDRPQNAAVQTRPQQSSPAPAQFSSTPQPTNRPIVSTSQPTDPPRVRNPTPQSQAVAVNSEDGEASHSNRDKSWFIPPIPCNEPEDGVFYAQMGSAGGKQGYSSITGRISWGIAWYINGLLIPEITVVRGRSYTFVVEGGDHQNNPAKRHPFYITNDSEGGYATKTAQEKQKVQIYAGADLGEDGEYYPTGEGRFCKWKESLDHSADDFESFGAFQRFLTLECEDGEPGIVEWTPDENTPDTVYYHCFTHRYLGWKIHVVDDCPSDQQLSGSVLRDKHETLSGNKVQGENPNEEDPNDPYVDQYFSQPSLDRNTRPSIVIKQNDVSPSRPSVPGSVQPQGNNYPKTTPQKGPVFVVNSQVQAEPFRAPQGPKYSADSKPVSSPKPGYQLGVVVENSTPKSGSQPSDNNDKSAVGFDPNTLVIESGFKPIKQGLVELPENYELSQKQTPVVGAIGHESNPEDPFNPIFRPSAPDKEVPGPHDANIQVTQVQLPTRPNPLESSLINPTSHGSENLPHGARPPNGVIVGSNNVLGHAGPEQIHLIRGQDNVQHHVVSGFAFPGQNEHINVNTQDQIPAGLLRQQEGEEHRLQLNKRKPDIQSVLLPPSPQQVPGGSSQFRFPTETEEILEYAPPSFDDHSHVIDIDKVSFPPSKDVTKKRKKISLVRNPEPPKDALEPPSSSDRRRDVVSSADAGAHPNIAPLEVKGYPIPYRKEDLLEQNHPTGKHEPNILKTVGQYKPLDEQLLHSSSLDILKSGSPTLSPFLLPPPVKVSTQQRSEASIPKNDGDVLLSTGYVVDSNRRRGQVIDEVTLGNDVAKLQEGRVYIVPSLQESAQKAPNLNILTDIWSSIQSNANNFGDKIGKVDQEDQFKYFERNERKLRKKRETGSQQHEFEGKRISNGHSNGQFTRDMDAEDHVHGNQAVVRSMEKESFDRNALSGSSGVSTCTVMFLTCMLYLCMTS